MNIAIQVGRRLLLDTKPGQLRHVPPRPDNDDVDHSLQERNSKDSANCAVNSSLVENALCQRCLTLDQDRPLSGGGESIVLSNLNQDCPLCKQFSAAIQSVLATCDHSVRPWSHFTLTCYLAPLRTCGLKFELGYTGRPRCLQFFRASVTGPMCSHVIRHKPLVKTVLPGQPDFHFVRDAIDDCRCRHKVCARQSLPAKTLRLIDCNTRKLVVLEKSQPYICLSYVWGAGAVEDTHEEDRLPSDLPKAIEDTVFVALKLGIPFLWVDRYCINQNDTTEKHDAIQNMDKIYQGAELTIIAIGSEPNDGLPGVRGTPRVPQCRLDIGNKTYLGVPAMASEIKKSRWHNRGWTFQECLLSTRRLVFTSSQMYFQCYQDCRIESVIPSMSALQPFFERDYPVFPRGGIGRNPQDLSSLLSEYYKRQLSFNTDTIHAVTGIINNFRCEARASPPISYEGSNHVRRKVRHDKSVKLAKNFYGLPVIHYGHDVDYLRQSFIHYLQWTVNAPQKKDATLPQSDLFPSWTWASEKANTQPDATTSLNMPPKLGAHPGYGRPWNYLGISIDVSHLKHGRMTITDFHAHPDDYMSFAPWLDITSWTLCLTPNMKAGTVRVMSDSYSLPAWAAREESNIIAVCLSLGIQSSQKGRPDQLLINGLLLAQKEPGTYRRIGPFHTGCLLALEDMSTEARKDWDYTMRRMGVAGCVVGFGGVREEKKRAWGEAMRVMDDNNGIVKGEIVRVAGKEMMALIEEGWVGPAILAQLPSGAWGRETVRVV